MASSRYEQVNRVSAFDQAHADLEMAQTLGPTGPLAFDFGMLCYEMGDLTCARQHMDRYIETYPGHVAAYEYRARIARDAGDYPSSLEDLERVFELQASPAPGLYIAASRLYEELDDPARGLAILDGGIDRLGMNPQLQRRAIEIELSLGHTDAAVKRWQSCRDVLKASVPWQVEMARLLILDDQVQPAGELLRLAAEKLTELRPTPARIKIGEDIRALQKKMRAGESPEYEPSNTPSHSMNPTPGHSHQVQPHPEVQFLKPAISLHLAATQLSITHHKHSQPRQRNFQCCRILSDGL